MNLDQSANQQMSYRLRPRTECHILHDSHTDPYSGGTGEAFLRWRGRQMGLLDVGYHYVVELDGSPIKCRPPEVFGSHCIGFNHVSVATCMIGGKGPDDKPLDTFTVAQRRTVLQVHLMLETLFGGGKPLPLFGHTELNRYRGRHRSLPCPSLDMDALRADLARYRSHGELPQ